MDKKETNLLNFLNSLKSLTIIGREWMDKNNNTYHSALLSINNEPFILLPITYGGSDQYLKTAFDYLTEKYLLPPHEVFIFELTMYYNVKILHTSSTVTSKKQLKRWY